MSLFVRSVRLATAALAVSSCGPRPTSAECDALLDRYTALLVRQSRPSARSEELDRLEREAREKATHDPAFAECPRRVSRSELECAMKAFDVDGMERCLL